jgi:GcrA cell cycle regulator
MDARVDDDFWGPIEARRLLNKGNWTDARVCKLREMHAAKAYYGNIALELGVTRNAICGKIKRLGLSVPMGERTWGEKRVQAPGWVRLKPKPKVRPERVAHFEKYPVADISLDLTVRTDLSCDVVGLTLDNCHWPVGDPVSDDFFFCGQVAIKGKSYCGAHCRVAYEPRKGPAQRSRSKSGNHFVGRA